MIKLSIIIPYYNTFELTEKLLDVLIPQLNDSVEVYLIDDGCHEEKLDKYLDDINIVHLSKNGGVSKSRNIGIKSAVGQYIAFIDSDDMVTPDYVDDLLAQIDERDESVIVFNWIDTTNGSINKHPQNPAVWKAIYKRSIIPLFDETLRAREDYFFQITLGKIQPSTYYYDKLLYMYNSNRVGSLWWNETHK